MFPFQGESQLLSPIQEALQDDQVGHPLVPQLEVHAGMSKVCYLSEDSENQIIESSSVSNNELGWLVDKSHWRTLLLSMFSEVGTFI